MKIVFNAWLSSSWRSHATYAALFWGAVAGLIMVWPVLMTVIPWWAFILGGVAISAAFALAKYYKRPGTE